MVLFKCKAIIPLIHFPLQSAARGEGKQIIQEIAIHMHNSFAC